MSMYLYQPTINQSIHQPSNQTINSQQVPLFKFLKMTTILNKSYFYSLECVGLYIEARFHESEDCNYSIERYKA